MKRSLLLLAAVATGALAGQLLLAAISAGVAVAQPAPRPGGGGGVTTVGTFGSTPTAKAASISGTSITMQPADATHPGAVTTGAQTFAGVKTFSSTPVLPGVTMNSTSDTIVWGGCNLSGLAIFSMNCQLNVFGSVDISAASTSTLKLGYASSTGTPGSVTNSNASGRFAVASGASSATVTNTAVSATSKVIAVLETTDTNCATFKVVPGSNSFVLTCLGGNAATNVTYSFVVFN